MIAFVSHHKLLMIISISVAILVSFILIEYLVIKYGGKPVDAPVIPRTTQSMGTGKSLNYVVMGDSTSIGQGSDYASSIGEATAHKLAASYRVNYTNVGISGATTRDVADIQLSKAVAYKPDVVLIAVGANDATHFTSAKDIQTHLAKIISGLIQANCNVKIVLTESPEMGSVPRFPWPADRIMSLRTNQVNSAMDTVLQAKHLTLAPIAKKTGPVFAAHPEYFAQDKFHPTAQGYSIWIPILNEAIQNALVTQQTHCM